MHGIEDDGKERAEKGDVNDARLLAREHQDRQRNPGHGGNGAQDLDVGHHDVGRHAPAAHENADRDAEAGRQGEGDEHAPHAHADVHVELRRRQLLYQVLRDEQGGGDVFEINDEFELGDRRRLPQEHRAHDRQGAHQITPHGMAARVRRGFARGSTAATSVCSIVTGPIFAFMSNPVHRVEFTNDVAPGGRTAGRGSRYWIVATSMRGAANFVAAVFSAPSNRTSVPPEALMNFSASGLRMKAVTTPFLAFTKKAT